MIRLHLGLPLQQVVMETVLPLSQSTKKSQSKTRIRHTLTRLIIRGFLYIRLTEVAVLDRWREIVASASVGKWPART